MKSEAMRSSRLTVNQARKKKNSSNKLSQSPTLASSYSQKSLWTHSYKNEPFPIQLRRKLWGKKFEFDFSSDQEEQITAVVEQEDEGNERKVKRLPHFKLIADQGEFTSKRSRIKSQFQFRFREKCKSVQSLKLLPRVEEQKKQEDELKNLHRSKLSYFKDKNEFNQRKRQSSDSHNSEIRSRVQSHQGTYLSASRRQLPEKIEENEAEETKSVKMPGSIITDEIQKLIVDELYSRKRKEEPITQDITEIIEEKLQEEDQNAKVVRLRQSLDRFQNESEYLKKLRDEQVVRKSGKDDDEESAQNVFKSERTKGQHNTEGNQMKRHHQAPLQRQKLEEYEDIKECSSSANQEDYLQVCKLAVIKEDPKEENKPSTNLL